jgi:epoxyqueuosine reductase QueG
MLLRRAVQRRQIPHQERGRGGLILWRSEMWARRTSTMYGWQISQEVCPWNSFATPSAEEAFLARQGAARRMTTVRTEGREPPNQSVRGLVVRGAVRS